MATKFSINPNRNPENVEIYIFFITTKLIFSKRLNFQCNVVFQKNFALFSYGNATVD